MKNKFIEEWKDFADGEWSSDINVRDFVQRNYTEYTGDDKFLANATPNTTKLWNIVKDLIAMEIKAGGVLDADTSVVSTLTSHKDGYIDKDIERIVGLQTDKPLKRSFQPFGGIRLSEKALADYGYLADPKLDEIFSNYRKTHNQGVFDVYTDEMKIARKSGIITGLPDAYGRGRIIGDYRRVALYGVDVLIEHKVAFLKSQNDEMNESTIRLREEITEQIKALHALKDMAKLYGYDISRPAKTAREAIQFTYFAYLGAIKEQNGAAMSFGRVSTFLDIYIERDLQKGNITEEDAQALMDELAIKLRMVRFMRPHEYNELFSGDPTWVTESIGGMSTSGHSLVTKNSYRILHSLTNLGPAPEPNLTVLWSDKLPSNFKKYCAKVSISTSAIQYENDDLMRAEMGDDYAIACCVSAMRMGKDMQFFGARANLAKCLLYAINGGIDELLGVQVSPKFEPVKGDYLDFADVMEKMDQMMTWLVDLYVNTLNVIHYMHDKYSYEALEMSLHDNIVHRFFATGIAGFSCVVDSLSAIKHTKVKVVRNASGLVYDYIIEGDYPKYGNNDDNADSIGIDLLKSFMSKLKSNETYRNSEATTSILTITSNVVYGKMTGNTPDGRKKGEPFAPGANPMHGRDTHGALASLQSVAKIPYKFARDGISNTFSIIPQSLGDNAENRINNLVTLLDGYTLSQGHHLNVNVFNKDTLLDAQLHPEKYPQLTIRVSGYAVNFIKLTKEQQDDVIRRTIHAKL